MQLQWGGMQMGGMQAMPPMAGMQPMPPMQAMQPMPPMLAMQPMLPMAGMQPMVPMAGHGGISTSVVNGVVLVNGEEIARVPPGSPVSLQTVNGVVFLNGHIVWPRGAAVGAGAAGAGVVLGGAGGAATAGDAGVVLVGTGVVAAAGAADVAMNNSRSSVCEANREEPCPVCLDYIQTGQHVRTLPCFHFLHRHCAEAHFNWSASNPDGAVGGPVLCPVCRAPVVGGGGG